MAAGLHYLVPAGGILYNSFMASGRGGDPSRFAKSNFPTWGSEKRLEQGDWIRLGMSGAVDGYVFDLARAKAIGPVSTLQVELFEAAIACIDETLKAIRPGATAGDLGAAGLGKQASLGFKIDGVFYFMAAAVLLLALVAILESLKRPSPEHTDAPFDILTPQAGPLAHDPGGPLDEPSQPTDAR